MISTAITAPLLIIEDNPGDAALIEALLERAFQELTPNILKAHNSEDAFRLLKDNRPCCCLIDYRLPSTNGLEILKALRQEFSTNLIPVIIMTGEGDERLAAKVMRHGAQDYLVKSDITPTLLIRSISNAIKTCELEKKLRHLAHYDCLTGLLNRSLFMDRLQQAMDKSTRYGQHCSLLFIDIDDFKQLNDHYGHQLGDLVLKTVGERLSQNCRATDSAARLGGDELALLIEHTDKNFSHKAAQKILDAVSEPLTFNDQSIQTSISIGIAHYPDSAKDIHEFISQADEAMYRAKRTGKSNFCSYDDNQKSKWERRKYLEATLPQAIKKQQLSISFQPIVDIETKILVSMEALCRWKPEKYTVSTSELINMVDQLNLFDKFHSWLFDTTMKQLSIWQQEKPDLQLSINIPANQCHKALLVKIIKQTLIKYRINPTSIELEITETTSFTNINQAKKVLIQLRAMGIRITLDDFGVGYSSIFDLIELPIDVLKIDKSFLINAKKKHSNERFIQAMTTMAHSLGIKVVAEGVETAKQLDLIQKLGCDFCQGFYVAKPMKADHSWHKFIRSFKIHQPNILNEA